MFPNYKLYYNTVKNKWLFQPIGLVISVACFLSALYIMYIHKKNMFIAESIMSLMDRTSVLSH